MRKLELHNREGHRIIVVSASLECWLKPWCASNGLELIATKMEVTSGKLTGRFNGKNFHGIEKVNRIKILITLNEYENIFAYGDSSGDLPILELAHQRFFKRIE